MENDRYNFGKHYIILDTKIDNHINSKNNPHNVTKADVALSEVENRPLDTEVTKDSINYVTSGAVYDVKEELQREIDEKAGKGEVVHIQFDETIEGSKTFNALTTFVGDVKNTFETENGTTEWEWNNANEIHYTFTSNENEDLNADYYYTIPVFDFKDHAGANFVIEQTHEIVKGWTFYKNSLTKLASYEENCSHPRFGYTISEKLEAKSNQFIRTKEHDKELNPTTYTYTLPDKNGYFVIDDSEVEYNHILHNVRKIEWEELKELRDSSELVPGQFYQITNFNTTSSDNSTNCEGHQFDIIVQALTENILSEEAKATYHINEEGEFDGYFADNVLSGFEFINPTTPEDIQILYKLYDDAEENSKIYADGIDEANTNITEIQWRDINNVNTPVLVNPAPSGEQLYKCYYVYDKTIELQKYRNSIVSPLYTISDSDEILYQTSENTFDNVFVKIDHLEMSGRQIPVLYKEDSDYLLSDRTSVDYGVVYFYVGDYILDGQTYNRWAKYDWEDDEIAGHWVSADMEILTQVIVVNNEFNITQNILDQSIYLEENKYDVWKEFDADGLYSGYSFMTHNLVTPVYTYSQIANLSAWKIKYCLDNNSNRFAWADEENGTGVIYYMKDEWNNEAPYDFKNIAFNYDSDQYFTFDFYDADLDEWKDLSLNNVEVEEHILNCNSNIIKPAYENKIQVLNHIIFSGNVQQGDYMNDGPHSNTFEFGCNHIFLGKDIKNLRVHKGVKGTEIKFIELEPETSDDYETNIFANGSKDIILD